MIRNCLLIVFLLNCAVHAQGESEYYAEPEATKTPAFTLKPTFTLGAGMLTYLGDVGSNNKGFHPTVSNPAYHVMVSNPLNSFLDLDFHAVFGSVSSSERQTERNLNLKSQITTGGLSVRYNFDHVLPEERKVEPFVSVGIESMEFLSKTDLYDTEGNLYHYWSDGSIMNVEETHPEAYKAQELVRDYNYETDLRELNLDGFGQYAERTWAMPVGVGVNMLLSDNWAFQMGSQLHLSKSDVIDNITPESIGTRAAKPGNDNLLHSYFSVRYAPVARKLSTNAETMASIDIVDLSNWDSDKDGVTDFLDSCQYTPVGVAVDAKGCPLDGDVDGIADFVDEEDASPHLIVDSLGIAMNDEKIQRTYDEYYDEVGKFGFSYGDTAMSQIESMKEEAMSIKLNELQYMIQVAQENGGVTSEMTKELLSLADVKSIETENNMVYAVGGYEDLDAAVSRLQQLSSNPEWNNLKIIQEQGGRIVNNQVKYNTISSAQDALNLGDSIVVFRVQIGAFSMRPAEGTFKKVDDLLILPGKDGLTRYMTGSFDNLDDAVKHKTNMVADYGFGDAFIVAYQGGDRVTLSSNGASWIAPMTEEEFIQLTSAGNSVDRNSIYYRIILGEYTEDIPQDELDLYLGMDNVEVRRVYQLTGYFFGSYTSREEADTALAQFKELGFHEPKLIGVYKGTFMSIENTERLIEVSEQSEE